MALGNDETLIKRQYLEDVSIFKAGEEAQEAYLIEEGEVLIFKGEEGDETEIARLQQGDIFGEMALIKKTAHKSNAKAIQRTVLVVINKDVLEEKMQATDPLIGALLHMFVNRLYKSNEDAGTE